MDRREKGYANVFNIEVENSGEEGMGDLCECTYSCLRPQTNGLKVLASSCEPVEVGLESRKTLI